MWKIDTKRKEVVQEIVRKKSEKGMETRKGLSNCLSLSETTRNYCSGLTKQNKTQQNKTKKNLKPTWKDIFTLRKIEKNDFKPPPFEMKTFLLPLWTICTKLNISETQLLKLVQYIALFSSASKNKSDTI